MSDRDEGPATAPKTAPDESRLSTSAEPPTPIELAPALDRLHRGDFRGARAAAAGLLRAAPSPSVERAAKAFLLQLAPDSWAIALSAIAAALLVAASVLFPR